MAFSLPPGDLSNLFDTDSIHSGQSYRKIKQWGGFQALQKILQTNYQLGLENTKEDRMSRTAYYGHNQPLTRPSKTLLQLIQKNLQDEMLRILCLASIISFGLATATEGLYLGWVQGGSILVTVIIIILVTSLNSYIQEKQFLKLNDSASHMLSKVRRKGETTVISAQELQVGDIIEVESGNIAPVDAILISSENLFIDQSSITGQIKEIAKTGFQQSKSDAGSNFFLISGSKIFEGRGTAVVVAVGSHSVFGKIKLRAMQPRDCTPLHLKLRELAKRIGRVSVVSALATFIILFLHRLYQTLTDQQLSQQFLTVKSLRELVKYFVLGVSIIVVSVPEGLPLSLTMVLAYTVQQMRKENNLVRQLQSCETMGEADCILCDKTGTLTDNKMSVCRLFVEETSYQSISKDCLSETALKLISTAIAVNSTATPTINLKKDALAVEYAGNKTECALLEMLYRMGVNYQHLRLPEKVIKTFPFSAVDKMMGTVFRDDSGAELVFVKGAPEILLPYCTNYLNSDSCLAKVTPEMYDIIADVVQDYAFQSLRTMLIAYKQVAVAPSSWQELPRDLTFLALVGIKDPLRKAVKESIEICKQSGVRVRMVTGDNKRTAIAVAKQCGILSQNWYEKDEDCTVMEGREFREFVGGLLNEGTPEERIQNIDNFRRIRDELCVLARSSPEDKYIMTVGLKQLGHVVAVTGDGTNDAPALRRADIGFAMGASGTDVAKEAADIVLLDDSFRTIVSALRWGRNVYDSIRKFLQFQLTVNCVVLGLALFGSIFYGESPLNAIQMLWVNLIMDTLAALALATESPSDNVLCRKPYPKQAPLVSEMMKYFVVWQSVWQLSLLIGILVLGPQVMGIPSSVGVQEWNEESGKHYAIFFNVFVFLQAFNQINCRRLNFEEANPFAQFSSSRLFFAIDFSIVALQFFAVKLCFDSMKLVALSFKENLLCLLLGSTSLLSGLAFKTVMPLLFMFANRETTQE